MELHSGALIEFQVVPVAFYGHIVYNIESKKKENR